jgi:branched-chain amino acid transport system substrate-binding protein
MRRRTIVLAGVFIMALGILSPSVQAQPKEVLIGGIWPLTGPNAPTGVECTQGATLAMEIINGKYDLNLPLAKTEGLPNLGGAKLKLVFGDHQNVPDKAMAEAERLITQEKVMALMGCYISGVTAPASQAAERRKVVFLDADAIAPTLIKRGFKYFFRVTQDDEIWFRDFMWTRFIPEVLKKKGGSIKNVAVLHENTLWGTDASKYGTEYAKKNGFNIVTQIAYPARSTSVTAEVQKLKMVEKQTDMLLSACYTADGILLMKSFHEMDYNPPMIWNDGGYREPAFLEALGKKSEFILQRDEFSVDMGERKLLVKQVNDLFRKRFGVDMNTNSSRNFMGAICLADAINRAGSTDSEAIRKALLATQIPPEQCICSWDGIQFDPNSGQNIKAVSLMLQVHENKWRLVWPFEVAVKDLAYPIPKWSARP